MRVPRAGPFQHDEQRLRAGIGPFQSQIVIDQLSGFRGEGEEAELVAFASYAELGFGQQYVVRTQSQHFGGSESMHEHQAHDGQVARGVETGPEARHFIHRERHDVELRLLHS